MLGYGICLDYKSFPEDIEKKFFKKTKKQFKESDIDYTLHGNSHDNDEECITFFIFVKESSYETDTYSNPAEIKPTELISPQTHWDEMLKNFCDTLKIKYKKPGWFLVTSFSF